MCAANLWIGASAATVAVLGGCGSSKESAPRSAATSPKSLPAGLVFKPTGSSQRTDASAEWGQCSGNPDEEGFEVQCDPNFPLTLVVGSQRLEITSKHQSGLMVDMVHAFGPMPIARDKSAPNGPGTVEFKEIDPATTVEVTFADGKSLKGALVPFEWSWAREALRRAHEKPITFGATEAAPPAGAPHSILYFTDSETSPAFVFGPAETLHDVDWVVTATDEIRDTDKKCGGYTVLGGAGPESTFPLELNERTLVLRDRRTGAEISRKAFLAPPKCPNTVKKERAIAYADPSLYEAWIRSELTKH